MDSDAIEISKNFVNMFSSHVHDKIVAGIINEIFNKIIIINEIFNKIIKETKLPTHWPICNDNYPQ